MTTDPIVTIASDLSVENEVINFQRYPLPAEKKLAGIGLIATKALPLDALLSVINFAYPAILHTLADHVVWLFVGTSAWQPNTRIVRYHGLWGALRARGLKLPENCEPQELLIESEQGVKLFGGVELSKLLTVDGVQILLKEPCVYLAALPKNIPPQRFMEIGWIGELESDARLLEYIYEIDALLIKPVGEFDAHERGIVAIGRPTIVSALRESSDAQVLRVSH